MNGTKKFMSVVVAIAVIGLGVYALNSNKGSDITGKMMDSENSTASLSNSYGDTNPNNATTTNNGSMMINEDNFEVSKKRKNESDEAYVRSPIENEEADRQWTSTLPTDGNQLFKVRNFELSIFILI